MSMETDRIEADLQQSRHRLNDTLAALGDKLSPGQMLDEALGLAQGQAGEFAKKLGSQVKDNPLPTLLIAAGVGMLLMNRNRHEGDASGADDWHHERRYRALEEARWSTTRQAGESDEAYDERLHSAYAKTLGLTQRVGEAAHEFKARIGQGVESARQAAEGVRDRAAQMLSGAKQAAMDGAQNIGQRAADAGRKAQGFYDDSPLAAGAIAMAVGAIIGSATPLSRPERETLSGLAEKATQAGADLAERGADFVESKMDRAVH